MAPHVMVHHITTPVFVRMDSQDNLVAGNYVEAGFGSHFEFGRTIHAQLLELPFYDELAEEGSGRSGREPIAAPGDFGPQCRHHEGLSSGEAFFSTKVFHSGTRYSFLDVLWNWWQGEGVSVVVHPFTQEGRAPDCP